MEYSISQKELDRRWAAYRRLLTKYLPQAGGLLVFSRLNIYYFSGTLVNGIFWLPVEGEPVLLCRRGVERAKQESPVPSIVEFQSYGDLETTCREFGASLPRQVAVEMNGLSWALSKSLQKALPGNEFVPGDKLIAMTRACKSEWELQILREAGKRHHHCLSELLPTVLHQGISELRIAHHISEQFFSQGHLGILRMETFGEEVFLGHIAIGDSANYPSVFNGPVGLRGAHPAAPFMGSETVHWEPGQPLIVDNGFTLAGYQTDKTQVYWLGDADSIPGAVQEAHNFCLEIQAFLANHLTPGAIPSELWSQCLERVAKSPWTDGFMGLGKNKVGFVGHGIGLAIDEYPVVARGFDLPLEEGMVLAIEPKIGLPGVGMVGTENTFEVTPQGGRSLTGEANDIICV